MKFLQPFVNPENVLIFNREERWQLRNKLYFSFNFKYLFHITISAIELRFSILKINSKTVGKNTEKSPGHQATPTTSQAK